MRVAPTGGGGPGTPPAGTPLLGPLPRAGPGRLLSGEGPRPGRQSPRRAPGRGRAAEPRPGGGPCPSYLLSRQAIHSAEEEEWAACAATMLGSGARCPRLRRPPALALPLPPPSPRRGPAPPGPPRDRRGCDGPALPAGSRGLPGGGPAREGTRGAGRGGPGGPEPPARPPAAALRRPGGGESRGPARCGEGTRGDPAWPATCDRWPPRLRETWAAPLTPGLRSVDGGKAPRVGRGRGGWLSVYIFFIQRMPLKWLLPPCFLRNPSLPQLLSKLAGGFCSPFPFPL